jgi:hypothetical protein
VQKDRRSLPLVGWHTFSATYMTFPVPTPVYIFAIRGVQVIGQVELYAGMIGKRFAKCQPKDYAIALHKTSFALPTTVTDDQHSMLLFLDGLNIQTRAIRIHQFVPERIEGHTFREFARIGMMQAESEMTFQGVVDGKRMVHLK